MGREARQFRGFEHWRQILCRCTESDTHANSLSESNCNGYCDCDCNSDSDCNCNSNGYSELHAQTNSGAKSSADACTAPMIALIGITITARYQHRDAVVSAVSAAFLFIR